MPKNGWVRGCFLSLIMVAMLVGWASRVDAQQASGSVTGTVTDPTGASVVNAAVTARDVDRNTTWTTQTNEAGVYEFPQISVGNIEVKVAATGFSTQVHPAFSLIVNQVARIDFQLQVGQITQTVEVSVAPPLLQTDSTEVGQLIEHDVTVALPLASRDVNQFTLLAPGVTSPNIFAFQANQTTFGTGRPYVNGAREQDNNFSIDGMDANQADNNEVAYVPSPDAIQDFNLIAGNAPADFGNYIGGVIVETIKSGTNQYHGDAFEFIRNTALNANSWQNNATGLPRSPLKWNEFGGTFGGPIFKNKLFFFVDYQESLFSTPATSVPFIPVPAAERGGDFSAICPEGFTAGICNNAANQLFNPFSSPDPAARTPYLNNQVPVMSAAAGNILSSSLYPSDSTINYLQHNYVNSYQGDAKIDWQPHGQRPHHGPLFANVCDQQHRQHPGADSQPDSRISPEEFRHRLFAADFSFAGERRSLRHATLPCE